jgi:hypothetical protein
LILLKSTGFPAGIDAGEAGRRGLVDAYFARAQGEIDVFALNLRGWRAGAPALEGAVPVRSNCLGLS